MDFINFSVENVNRYDVRSYLTNTVKVLVVLTIRVLLWINWLVLNIFTFNAFWKKPQTLPKIKFEFYNKSAAELRDLLISRQITSYQIVEAYINRAKEVDRIINCVVENRFEDALKEAEKVDKLIANTDDVKMLFGVQPLLGIPFTVKENLAVKGLKHASARTRVPTRIAEKDAGAVERIRRFGGIPLLVSNSPELCMNLETVSKKNGRALNPYDTTRTTGGSSGGEAGLLGAGASIFGLASDLAGSIRIPCMFCGVFGHKPTPGYVPIEGHIPYSKDPMFDYFFTVGPIVKRAADLKLVFKLLVPEEKQHNLRLDEKVNVSNLNIYYMFGEGNKSFTQSQPNDRVQKAIETAVENLESHFHCKCQLVQLPYLMDSITYNGAIFNINGLENAFQRSEDPDDWSFFSMLFMFIKKLIFMTDTNFGALSWGPLTLLSRFTHNMYNPDITTQIARSRKQFSEMLGDNAVFLYPTFPVEARLHNDLTNHFFNVSYTSVFNVLGVPATQVPIKVPGNLPVGIQVVAAPDQDRLCFAVASALEETCGGWVPPA
ncbi:hypothetical protein GE061_011122 [Apolygus lucorum]|uniref:Amidase domain-containing protein n=1 Tax=Apolygus lucorum TaxID=248454 RepID=A0A8S9XWU7_APOLU|nr:hypothetical protein GE061_011122 [Apolygus lucorum]